MSKTVLVTGAAGFIGSHIVEALALRGDRVVGLDNFDPYYEPAIKHRNVAQVRAALDSPNDFELVVDDVCDRPAVERLYERVRPDVVVHLAALAGVRASVGQAARYFDVNLIGTLNLLDACVQYDVPQFVFASTSSVYGHGTGSGKAFLETDACDRPLAPYPAAKRAAELLGYTYHNLHSIQFTALRFFSVYGPRNRPDMMAHWLLESVTRNRAVALFDGGRVVRDWTFVGDIVRGVVAAVDSPLGYEIINLGRGEPISLADFLQIVEELSGRKANVRSEPVPPGDARETFADIAKARALLGYAPNTSLREGIKQLWDWYRAT